MHLVPLTLLALLWAASACAIAWPNPRVPSRWIVSVPRWIPVTASLAILATAAMAIALPQFYTDIDTWIELFRYRLRREFQDSLIRSNRPFHYWLEYHGSLWAEARFGIAPRELRIATTMVSFGGLLAALFASRRVLFLSSGMRYPIMAAATFLISPGGERLLDSWNDHLPLTPFMVAGTAALLGFHAAPSRCAAVALGAFAAESALHAAEPWLWGGGVFLLAAAAWRAGDRRHAAHALALGIAMVAISAAILWAVPDRKSDAFRAASTYLQTDFGLAAARQYWRTQAVGGPWPTFYNRGGIAAAASLAAFGALCAAVRLARRGRQPSRPSAWLWPAWTGVAVVYPAIYETTNPERYWTLAVLWSIMVPKAFAGLAHLARLKRPARSAWSIWNPRVRRAAVVAGLLAVSAPTVMSVPGLFFRSKQRDVYLEAMPRMTAAIPPDSILVIAPHGSYFLFAGYLFPGPVRMVEKGERVSDVLAAVRREHPGAPVATLSGATVRLMDETSPTIRLIWERDQWDSSARVHLVEKP